MVDKAYAESERIVESAEVLISRVDLKAPAPLKYAVTVEVQGETGWSSDYMNLNVEVEFPVGPTLDADAVERAVAQAKKDGGNLRVEINDGIRRGDVGVVDISAVDASGNPIESAQQAGFRLDTDQDGWFDELLEGVYTMKVNEERTIECSFPDPWDPPELSNTAATFTVKLKELFRWDLAEEGPELAARLVEGASDMDSARSTMLVEARKAREEAFEKQLNESIGYALGDIYETSVPTRMVEENGRELYGGRLLEMLTTGAINREMLDRLSNDEMVRQFVDSNREMLVKQTRADLAIAAVREERGLEVTPEEVEEEVERQANDLVEKEMAERSELDMEQMRTAAVQSLGNAKVFSFLRNNGVAITVKDPDSGATITIARPDDEAGEPGSGGAEERGQAEAASAIPDDIASMKGTEVDARLKELGLPRTGRVAERRARLAEALESGASG